MKKATMNPREFINQLRAEVEEQNRIHSMRRDAEAAAKLAKSIQQIKRTKPLDDQINDLMQTIPPALRARPWSIAELVPRLQGKYREHPHAKEVGEALRRLGWRRTRLWGNAGEGRRVWVQ